MCRVITLTCNKPSLAYVTFHERNVISNVRCNVTAVGQPRYVEATGYVEAECKVLGGKRQFKQLKQSPSA